MALTPKQRRFVDEYLLEPNASKAALKAGYPKASAHSIGSENLHKPEIAAAIKKGLDFERAKLVRKAARKEFTKERWLEELRTIALSNMDDHAVVEEFDYSVTRDEGEETRAFQRVNVVNTADRPRKRGRAIKKLTDGKHGVSVELHDKRSALETLGKAYGWLTNDMNLNMPDNGVQVIVTLPSNGREVKIPDTEGEGNGGT